MPPPRWQVESKEVSAPRGWFIDSTRLDVLNWKKDCREFNYRLPRARSAVTKRKRGKPSLVDGSCTVIVA
jgi:hypothetical protein